MAEETQRLQRSRWAIAIVVVALTLALLVRSWTSSPANVPAANPSLPAPAAHDAAAAAAGADEAPRVRPEAAISAPRTITLIASFAGAMPPPTVLEATCRVRPGDRETTPSITGDRVAVQLPTADWTQLDVSLSGSNFMPSRQLVLPADVDAEGLVRVVVKPRSTLTLRAVDAAGTGVANLRLILAPNRSGAAREPVADLEVTTDALGTATLSSIAAGTYTVQCVGGDQRVLTPASFTVAPGLGEVRITVVPAVSWDMTGRVVTKVGGQPVPDATIKVFGEAAASTDEHGRFRVPGGFRRDATAHSLTLAVTPPASLPLTPAHACGPYAWGDTDVEIALLPGRHVLRIGDENGTPVETDCSFKLAQRGLTQATDWAPLQPAEPGRFVLPWSPDWEGMVWLRCGDDVASAQRHARLHALPTEIEPEAVVHRWIVRAEAPLRVEVVDEVGRPIANAAVQALHQLSAGAPAGATIDPNYDPTTANPFVANAAALLGEAVTGSDGTCMLRVAAGDGTWIRVRHPHCSDTAVRLLTTIASVRIVMEATGSIRATLRDHPGMRLQLIGKHDSRRRYPKVMVKDHKFTVDKVPVGPCIVAMAVPSDRAQPWVVLGDVEVVAGQTAEVELSAAGWRLLPTSFAGDFEPGDEVAFHDCATNLVVATLPVSDRGEIRATLTPSRYRLLRTRRDVEQGGAKDAVWSQQELRVNSDQTRHAVTFPAERVRWRLLRNGAAIGSAWVRIAGTEQVVRTDRDGWLVAWPNDRAFEVAAVQHGNSAWRPTGVRWQLRPEAAGQDVESFGP